MSVEECSQSKRVPGYSNPRMQHWDSTGVKTIKSNSHQVLLAKVQPAQPFYPLINQSTHLSMIPH